MIDPADITLTLVTDAFDTYRVTSHSALGASFISVHVPGDTPERALSATDAKLIQNKAERHGLAVRIE
jgi:hypothetical protein